MSDGFTPIKRSQVWLGEKADADEWRLQGQRIAERLSRCDDDELFAIAADAHNYSRIRRMAASELTRESKQRLVDEVVQRIDDPWWTIAVQLCPPTRNDVIIAALKHHSNSGAFRSRTAALVVLSHFGDDSIASDVEELLQDDENYGALHAIKCLAVRNSDASLGTLRKYVESDENPLFARVRAAEALLSLGNDEVLEFLYLVAQDKKDEAAYYAACAIQFLHDKHEAYRLFAAMLSPDHPAAPRVAIHVATEMRNHEIGFEPDALSRTRQWLVEQLEKTR